MKALLATLLLAVSTVATATTGRIGTTEFTIPAPAGFAPVTTDMVPLHGFLENLVAENSGQLVSFIEQALVAEALQGGVPDSRRTFSVQYPLAAADITLSSRDFAQIRQVTDAQNAELARTINERRPNLMDQANQGLSEIQEHEQNVSLSAVVPLPAHENDERRYSYSAHVTLQVSDSEGNAVPFRGVMNLTFLHLRGKILFLMAQGAAEDLEWTRRAASTWTTAVIEANPDTPRP